MGKKRDFYRLKDGFYFSDDFIGYCRSHAIEKFKPWLKDLGFDPAKVQIVHTHSQQLSDGFKHAIKFIFRVVEKGGNVDRPPCPECESTHVISRGKEWYCRKCGKYWSKIRRRP